MNSGVLRLDQIMSILPTNLLTHAEHNLIKLKLYNNWSVQAVNIISECATWYLSKKPEDGENLVFKALANRFW